MPYFDALDRSPACNADSELRLHRRVPDACRKQKCKKNACGAPVSPPVLEGCCLLTIATARTDGSCGERRSFRCALPFGLWYPIRKEKMRLLTDAAPSIFDCMRVVTDSLGVGLRMCRIDTTPDRAPVLSHQPLQRRLPTRVGAECADLASCLDRSGMLYG